MADADTSRLARGNLLVDLRDDRSESPATFQQQKADHDFLVEEHELDTNTELTRAIARLTHEIHQAVVVPSPETASE